MDATIPGDSNSAATYNHGNADGYPSPSVPDSDPVPYTGLGKDGKTKILGALPALIAAHLKIPTLSRGYPRCFVRITNSRIACRKALFNTS
jgi:hypothetical protein